MRNKPVIILLLAVLLIFAAGCSEKNTAANTPSNSAQNKAESAGTSSNSTESSAKASGRTSDTSTAEKDVNAPSGSGKSGNTSSGNTSGSSTDEEEPIWKKDDALLTANGYSVSHTYKGVVLSAQAPAIQTDSKNLDHMISAVKTVPGTQDGQVILIYYLKTEEAAAESAKALSSTPAFKKVGTRIVKDDNDNLIH